MTTFRQPNDLARTLNHLLDQLHDDEVIILEISLRDRDAGAVRHVLDVAREVARVRGVEIEVDL